MRKIRCEQCPMRGRSLVADLPDDKRDLDGFVPQETGPLRVGEQRPQEGGEAKQLRWQERSSKDGQHAVTCLDEFSPVAPSPRGRIPRGKKSARRGGGVRLAS